MDGERGIRSTPEPTFKDTGAYRQMIDDFVAKFSDLSEWEFTHGWTDLDLLCQSMKGEVSKLNQKEKLALFDVAKDVPFSAWRNAIIWMIAESDSNPYFKKYMVESLDDATVRIYANVLYNGINDETWFKQQATRHSRPLGESDDPERFDKLSFWEEGIDPQTGEFTSDQWIAEKGIGWNWQIRVLDKISDPEYLATTALDESADELLRLLALKKLSSYRDLSGSEEFNEYGLDGDELSKRAEDFLSGLARGDIGMIYPVRVEDQPTRWSNGMPQPWEGEGYNSDIVRKYARYLASHHA